MFSKATQYGIRAVLHIANNANRLAPIGALQISKDINIPKPFLSKLLQQISRNDIISSIKGKNGGFFLNKQQLESSLWKLIVLLGDGSILSKCYLGLSECGGDTPCPIHHIALKFKGELEKELKEKSIQTFSEEINESNIVLGIDFNET